LHAPGYQSEHKSALASDWAHIPIPKSKTLLERAVRLADQVVTLLDATADARPVVEAILTTDRGRCLGREYRRPLLERRGVLRARSRIRLALPAWWLPCAEEVARLSPGRSTRRTAAQ